MTPASQLAAYAAEQSRKHLRSSHVRRRLVLEVAISMTKKRRLRRKLRAMA